MMGRLKRVRGEEKSERDGCVGLRAQLVCVWLVVCLIPETPRSLCESLEC